MNVIFTPENKETIFTPVNIIDPDQVDKKIAFMDTKVTLFRKVLLESLYMKILEQYIIDNNLVAFETNTVVTRNSFHYTIFTSNHAWNIAIELAKELKYHGSKEFIYYVNTKIKDKRLEVYVDKYKLATIVNADIGKHKIKRKGLFSGMHMNVCNAHLVAYYRCKAICNPLEVVDIDVDKHYNDIKNVFEVEADADDTKNIDEVINLDYSKCLDSDIACKCLVPDNNVCICITTLDLDEIAKDYRNCTVKNINLPYPEDPRIRCMIVRDDMNNITHEVYDFARYQLVPYYASDSIHNISSPIMSARIHLLRYLMGHISVLPSINFNSYELCKLIPVNYIGTIDDYDTYFKRSLTQFYTTKYV